MGQLISDFADWLRGLIESVLEWFRDLFQWIAAWVVDAVLSPIAALIESFPVPDAFAQIGPAWSAAAADLGYFIAPFKIGEGLTLLFGALAIRWLIRRLPVVG